MHSRFQLTGLFCALFMMLPFLVKAQTFKDGNINYTVLSAEEKTVEIGKNMQAMGNITIPETVTSEGIKYKVVAVGDGAFLWSDITGITLPATITEIKQNAFSMCPLQSIVIPDNVTELPKQAFNACSSLESVTLPKNLITIGETVFNGCKKLTSIEIPSKVKSIGEKAFIECTGLTEITLPESLESLGALSFKGCTALESLNIPANVAEIGAGALAGCSGLKSLTVDEANNNFSAASGILYSKDMKTLLFSLPSKETVNIPSGVSEIAASAFEGCKDLTSVRFPSSLRTIGESAFSGCSSLQEIELNSGLQTVGEYAFYGCSSMWLAVISNSVTTLGSRAFQNCTALRQVNLGNGVTAINDNTFDGCSALKAFTMGNSVASIGDLAFQGCKALKGIELTNSVKTIGTGAFSGCSSLTAIIFGTGLETIKADAFSGTALTSITALGDTPAAVANNDVFSEDMYYDAILYVNQSAVAAYQGKTPWSYFDNVQRIKYNFEPYSILPKKGTDLRAIKEIKVSFNSPDKELMPLNTEDAYKLVTLTRDGGSPVYPTRIAPIEDENITTIAFSFPTQTEEGTYTFTMPQGVIYEVEWDNSQGRYVRIKDQGNQALTSTYTVNPQANTVFTDYVIHPATRSTIACLQTVSLSFPNAEYALDTHSGQKITLTQIGEDIENPKVYTGVLGGWGNEPKITFEDETDRNVIIREAGTWRLDIPQNFFTQNGVGNDRIRVTYFIDPTVEAVYSVDPESGSKISIPMEGVMEITFNFYNSVQVSNKPATAGAGFTVTYGSLTLPKVVSALGTRGWQMLDNPGDCTMTIRINQNVFEQPGVLKISGAKGALTIDGNPSPEIEWFATCGDVSAVEELVDCADSNAPIYNLQGISVGNDFDTLPAGIYIRNGKRIIKK